MTDAGVLLLSGIFLVAFPIGAAISIYMRKKARWVVLLASAVGPIAVYLLWGTTEGCVLSPHANPQQCFGWGFGLILFAAFAMPAWLIGLLLGYFNPWSRKYRASK